MADDLAEHAPACATLAFRLLLMTGARIGEVASLTWGAIGDEAIVLAFRRIRRACTQGG